MKNFVAFALPLALLLGLSARYETPAAAADEAKPILIVSVTSVDKLLANVDTIGDIAGSRLMTDFAKAQAVPMLAGIDTKRPLGVVVTANGPTFTPLGFVPVTDFKKVMATLRAEDKGDGIYQLAKPGPAFVKEKGGWAFIAEAPESLATLPDDPVKMLAGQEKEYDIAVRGFVQNVPEFFKTTAIEAIKAGVTTARKLPNESDDEFELRKKAAKGAINQVVSMINETDQVTLGWSIDGKEKKTFLDVSITAVSGSKLAKQFGYLAETKSQFAGFLLPDAAATLSMSSKVSAEDAEQATTALKAVRDQVLKQIDKDRGLDSDAAKAAVKDLVGDVMDVIDKTIQGGKIDGAAALILQKKSLTFVSGGHFADATKLDAAFKKLVELAKNAPDFPKDGVKFDADSHKGVRFHTINIPVKDANAAKALGDQMEFTVGFGESSAYMAFGKDTIGTLKKAIDQSEADAGKTVPPAQFIVAIGPILEFAASVDENPIVAMLAEEAKKVKGKDRLLIYVRPISNGAAYRFEVEQGIIGLAGKAAAMFGGARGPGF